MRYDDINIDGVSLMTVHGDIVGDESRRRLVDHVRTLLMTDQNKILLDLSSVKKVDSRGLGELIECYSAAKGLGGAVKLLGVGERLADLLVITKLVNVFECFETRETALASFAPVAVSVR